jgi:hypothetical protein
MTTLKLRFLLVRSLLVPGGALAAEILSLPPEEASPAAARTKFLRLAPDWASS